MNTTSIQWTPSVNKLYKDETKSLQRRNNTKQYSSREIPWSTYGKSLQVKEAGQSKAPFKG